MLRWQSPYGLSKARWFSPTTCESSATISADFQTSTGTSQSRAMLFSCDAQKKQEKKSFFVWWTYRQEKNSATMKIRLLLSRNKFTRCFRLLLNFMKNAKIASPRAISSLKFHLIWNPTQFAKFIPYRWIFSYRIGFQGKHARKMCMYMFFGACLAVPWLHLLKLEKRSFIFG